LALGEQLGRVSADQPDQSDRDARTSASDTRIGLIDNGTSLGEAWRSPAESARRWRPASALGRPVSLAEECLREAFALALGEQLGRVSADQPDRSDRDARTSASDACHGLIDNGTSLGEARRSPAESARRWRPASALGRPVSLAEECLRDAVALALG